MFHSQSAPDLLLRHAIEELNQSKIRILSEEEAEALRQQALLGEEESGETEEQAQEEGAGKESGKNAENEADSEQEEETEEAETVFR